MNARALLLLAAASCTGGPKIEPPPPPDHTPAPCTTGALPERRIVRLTHPQYAATLQSALALPAAPDVSTFPLDPVTPAGQVLADELEVSSPLAQDWWDLTEERVAAADLRALGCADPADEACVRALLGTVGRRAFRRPVEPAELDALTQTWSTVKIDNGGDLAARAALHHLLLSPGLLYRTELGLPDPADPKRVALTPHELAAALAYVLTDAPPDAPLAASADDATLVDPAVLVGHARRLLSGEPSRAVVGGFLERWLGIDRMDALTRDPQLFPLYQPGTMAALHREAGKQLQALLEPGTGGLRALLGGEVAYASELTAGIWGLPPSALGGGVVKVQLDPAQRRGIFTHPGVIAAHSQSMATGLVGRGRFLASEVLCISVPEPPPNVDPSAFNTPQPGLTVKQRWQQHSANPACAGCHRTFDALGLALESYDALGVYRTIADGLPVDPTGDVTFRLGDDPVHVDSAVDLASKLAARTEAYQCFARQMFRFTSARHELDADTCRLRRLDATFEASGFDVNALVVGLFTDDGFLHRRTE